MFWFLIYFAIASFSTDKSFKTDSSRKDFAFDVAQSIAALLAVFYLGFVTRGNSGPRIDYGYVWANSVILLLSLLSWIFFSWPRRDKYKKSRGWCFCFERISVLRELGIFLSLLGIPSALLQTNSLRTVSLYVLQAFLWCVLWSYWRIRWNHDENDPFENERIAIFDTVLKRKCAAKETTPVAVRTSSAQPFAQSSGTNEIAPAPEPNSQNPSVDPGK
jgi:hypothetical protein